MKQIKILLLTSLVMLFTACGGGSSSADTTVPINPDTPQTIAIDKIMLYADDNTQPAPTIQDYEDAGIVGVTLDNIDDVNSVVANLTASDVDTTEKIQKIVDDLGINILPIANAGLDKNVVVGNAVTITGTSTDIDGTIVSYEWTKDSEVLATTASFEYIPTAVGTDTLTLTVMDNDGGTASDSMTVVVIEVPPPVNNPPVVDAGPDQNAQVGQTITITGTGIDSDGTIVSYSWTKGTEPLAFTDSFDYTPTTEGTDILTLTVTDNDGAISSDSMTVTVTVAPAPNNPPVANAGVDQNAEVGQTITITGTGTDSDGTIASYEWKKGTTVLANTATFSYTPTAVGTDTLTLTVTDDDGATASDEMNVIVSEATTVSFVSDVMAIFVDADKGDCKSCHTTSSNRTFKVGDAAYTYDNIINNNLINTADPDLSSILIKGNGGDGHKGGDQLSDVNSEIVRDWIVEGGLNN